MQDSTRNRHALRARKAALLLDLWSPDAHVEFEICLGVVVAGISLIQWETRTGSATLQVSFNRELVSVFPITVT